MADECRLPMPPPPWRLCVTMRSDWHIGSGTGRPGHVDRLVIRDADGLPYLPAKTLTGMWRDACERLVRGLDNGASGAWSAWVPYLFGDQPARKETDPARRPRPARVSVRSAHFADSLRERLRFGGPDEQRRRVLQAGLTFIKPGIQIDAATGRARDEHLRFEEMCRAGIVLTAQADVNLPPDSDGKAAGAALLLAATRLIERLGGKRRRGAGRCEVEVEGADVEAAVAWLAAHPEPPNVPATGDISPVEGSEPIPSVLGDGWVGLPFTLELHTPLNISSRTVGNVVESLDFVPGTFLLPHFTRAFATAGINIRGAIARGDLRVLPATLEVDGHQGRPIPLALYRQKEEGCLSRPQTLRNRLVDEESENEPQLKQCRGGYLGIPRGNSFPRHETVAMFVRTHNTIAEESQRPTPEVGGVYSYECLGASHLCGELRLRRDLAERLQKVPDWQDRLSGSCRLGRSKKDDYGRATLRFDEIAEGDLPDCPAALAGPPGKLYVWLLSDTLLRDERLRFSPTVKALAAVLSERLGVGLEAAGHAAFVRVRRAESWQVEWGLPRASLVALQAGTCVVFDCTAEPPLEALTRVEAEGLGERTAEGYGQVRFNDPLLTQSPRGLQPPAAERGDAEHGQAIGELPPLPSDDPGYACARLIEEHVWREAIGRRCLQVAQAERHAWLGWDTSNDRPPMSQLGALRATVNAIRGAGDVRTAIAWLMHLVDTKRRAQKWPGQPSATGEVRQRWFQEWCRDRSSAGPWPTGDRELSQLGALDRLGLLLTDPEQVWRILDCPAERSTSWPTVTEGAGRELRDRLWPLAVRSLVEACVRARKRELDRQSARRR